MSVWAWLIVIIVAFLVLSSLAVKDCKKHERCQDVIIPLHVGDKVFPTVYQVCDCLDHKEAK